MAHVTDQDLMTALSVTTKKLSVTMESVWLSVLKALTMMKQPMNAEIVTGHV